MNILKNKRGHLENQHIKSDEQILNHIEKNFISYKNAKTDRQTAIIQNATKW